jgi:predicted secreted protein
MATTGVVSASDIFIYTGDGVTKIAEITSATLNLTHTPRQIKSNDTGDWVKRAAGEKDWEMSGNSLFRFDATHGFSELFAMFLSGAAVKVTFKTADAADAVYSGNAVITQLQATGSTGENETYSFTFAADGELSED